MRLDHLTSQERSAYVIAHNSLNQETGFDNAILLAELDKLKEFKFDTFGLNVSELYTKAANDDFYKQMLEDHTQKLVRNQFFWTGKYDMPIIHKQEINLSKIKLRSFANVKIGDVRNKNKTIHFFLHDHKFDFVYSNPALGVERIKNNYCLLTPDFSLYMDMPLALQINNTFKNRWCGAHWQSLGFRVIPTISWSDERSFEFCFDGVERGSVVAVSTHGNKKVKDEFMLGYNKMLQILEPNAIICYGKPFKEMRGTILTFLYNRHEHSEA